MKVKRTVCLILLLASVFALFSCNKTAATSESETQTKNMERPAAAGIRVTFVGTSHGVPEANRQCSCTMLEVGGNVYFVDMGVSGADTLAAKGIAYESVKGIFITHMHGDHTDGLINFIDLASWCYSECNPTVLLPDTGAVESIRQWLSCTDVTLRDDIPFGEVKAGEIYDDGVLKVTAIENRHCEKSYCLLLEAEGKKLLFTGDLHSPTDDLPGIISETDIDLLVCEGAHFSPLGYINPLSGSRVKAVAVNHYTPSHYGDILALDLKLADIPVVAATDGYEIVLN